MLKTITLKNFVHFKEKVVIQLATSNNPANSNGNQNKERSDNETDYFNPFNVFVGANFCGKSTVLELIRRCMTQKINLSKTISYDKGSIAYAFCIFNELRLPNDEVISGIIKEPNTPEDGVGKLYKFFIYIEGDEIFIRSTSSNTRNSYNAFVRQTIDTKKIKKLKDGETDEGITHLLNEILKRSSHNTDCSTFRDKPSWEDIENHYIATFPLRGIGIVQWTKSKNIRVKRNYKSACERAEIISTLLSKKHRNQINEEFEKENFNFLTYPEVFRFKNKNGHIFVQHNKSEEFHLLKTSEGILEAKMTSLLLAHKDVKTLCLEDAERGMHPQMIERLKTVLWRAGTKKTIILVTHSPYFIDTISVKNTHVFFRKPSNDRNSYICSVRNVAHCSAISKVSSIDLLRTLLFATKVLLVEGPTDREVVQGIFTQWKRNLFERTEIKIGDLYKDITTYQVVSLNGCRNSENIKLFCTEINLPHLCVLDLDNFVKIDKSTQTISKFEKLDDFLSSNDDYKNILKSYVNDDLSEFSDSEVVLKVSEYLESEDSTFVWKDGAIEDMIRRSKYSKSICNSLGCDNTDSTEIKKKLKKCENDREDFYAWLMEEAEIERLIKFILKKEGTRIDDNDFGSDEFSSEQKCCNIFHVLGITFSIGMVLMLLFCFLLPFLKEYFF